MVQDPNETGEAHRRRMMTRDERAIDARDRVAKNLYDQGQRDNNKNMTYEQAQRIATKIAEKVEQNKK